MDDDAFDAARDGATGSPQPECWRAADELAEEATRARQSESDGIKAAELIIAGADDPTSGVRKMAAGLALLRSFLAKAKGEG